MAKGGRCSETQQGEVREMRNAETVLGIIRERGRQGLPLEDIYRQLYNRELYLLAYGRLARNQGAMTPGTTGETVDGMCLAKIDALIDAVRHECYRWTPVRRTYIPKANGKVRPLGIPIVRSHYTSFQRASGCGCSRRHADRLSFAAAGSRSVCLVCGAQRSAAASA